MEWKVKTKICLGYVLLGGSQVDGVVSIKMKLAWVMSSLEGARHSSWSGKYKARNCLCNVLPGANQVDGVGIIKTKICLGHVLPRGSQVDGVGSIRIKLAWVMSSLEGAR